MNKNIKERLKILGIKSSRIGGTGSMRMKAKRKKPQKKLIEEINQNLEPDNININQEIENLDEEIENLESKLEELKIEK